MPRINPTEAMEELRDFDYWVDESDSSPTVTIVRYSGESHMVTVTIPASIEGIPVTAIGESAFMNCKGMANVILPEGIRSIGDYAFYGCISLGGINLPEGLCSIGSEAFSGCASIKDFRFPESITSIGDFTFAHCMNIKSITLTKGIAHIGDNAFIDCHSLTEIIVDKENPVYASDKGVLFDKNMTTLLRYPQRVKGDYIVPDTVIAIEDDAFSGYDDLTCITLPQNTVFINTSNFSDHGQLTDIIVNENNLELSSIDGVLFNKGGNKLLRYPQGRKNEVYVAPEETTIINDGAFSGCQWLTNITLPMSLQYIGKSAFKDCPRLEGVRLSRKMKVGYKAFEGFTGQFVYGD
jgi:hypothetical protein